MANNSRLTRLLDGLIYEKEQNSKLTALRDGKMAAKTDHYLNLTFSNIYECRTEQNVDNCRVYIASFVSRNISNLYPDVHCFYLFNH